MSGFQFTNQSGVLVHIGDRNCDDAHAALLAALTKMRTNFMGASEQLTVSQLGNLGEFIALHIGRHGTFAKHETFAHNAIQPLTKISGAGIDLMYVYFDAADEGKDLLYVQETKTTTQDELQYFGALQNDYRKLFSTDINLTLQSRLSYLSNAFEIERGNDEYAR